MKGKLIFSSAISILACSIALQAAENGLPNKSGEAKTSKTNPPSSVDLTMPKLSFRSLQGKWWGHTNEMACMVVFNTNKASIYTFHGDKHLSTVFTHFHVDQQNGIVELGINGEAQQIPENKLFLKFRAYNTNLITIKDVVLEKTDSSPQWNNAPAHSP